MFVKENNIRIILKKYIVEKPIKVLDALKEMYPDSSNQTLRNLLKHKRISVNSEIIVKANFLLELGSEITIGQQTQSISYGIEILHEDKDILVINKPEVLLSVPLDTKKTSNALDILRNFYNTSQIFAVHRIDKETSGVMIFAKGIRSMHILNRMFKLHDFKRVYLAIVKGYMKEASGTWKSRLIEKKNLDVKSTTNPEEGKDAITHFTVLRRSKNFSYLKLELETGRKHQIRVHCKDARHPILGDKRYSDGSEEANTRICLHASLIEFSHPITQKLMSFSSPLPSRFTKFGFFS